MKKADFILELIKDDRNLAGLAETLISQSALSLDIETTEWWNRQREKISLIQVAYRQQAKIKVAVVDAFAGLNFDLLKIPLETGSIIKVVHNSSFDVPRLAKHYSINVSPVFDTMRAARAGGERKYSLAAQSLSHLNLYLDKSPQRSDWSRRPLATAQIYYAAVDSYAALLLYENQIARGLKSGFLRKDVDTRQIRLPLSGSSEKETFPTLTDKTPELKIEFNVSDVALTMLGIVAELPTRYTPDALAASVGADRIGLAGWIIDRRLGADAELDEETVKITIADLCERQFLQLNETRRLIATDQGIELWKNFKNH